MAANAQGISARADVFGDQILQHILSLVPRSSELALRYSFRPKTRHYLEKAGWPAVLKKLCHWKEADTICICCGASSYEIYQSKARSIEHVWKTMAAERCYICGHCNDCVVDAWEQPADWLEDLAAFTEMLELRSCPWRCPDKDRPQ